MANSIYKDPEETVFYYIDSDEWQQVGEGITDIDVQVLEFENQEIPTAKFDDYEEIILSLIDDSDNVTKSKNVNMEIEDRLDIILENLYERKTVTESLLEPTEYTEPTKWIKKTDKGYRLTVTGGEAGYSYCAVVILYTESMRKKDIYVPIFVRKYYER